MTYTLTDGRTITTRPMPDEKTLFELTDPNGDCHAYVVLPNKGAAELVERHI